MTSGPSSVIGCSGATCGLTAKYLLELETGVRPEVISSGDLITEPFSGAGWLGSWFVHSVQGKIASRNVRFG